MKKKKYIGTAGQCTPTSGGDYYTVHAALKQDTLQEHLAILENLNTNQSSYDVDSNT